MMNALYGRFGMHPEEGISTFVNQDGLNDLIQGNTIVSEVKIGQMFLIEYLPKPPEGPPNLANKQSVKAHKPRPMETNVPIAAAVTAYSRMIINSHKLEAERQRVGSEVEWCGKLSATTSYRKPNNQVVFYASTSSFLLCKPAVFWSDPAICLDLLSFQETPPSTASTFHLKNVHNSRIICSFLGLNIV